MNEAEDEEEGADLKDNSRWSLLEDPVRNLDFEAHGRKTATEACVVTVAMSPAGVLVMLVGKGKGSVVV